MPPSLYKEVEMHEFGAKVLHAYCRFRCIPTTDAVWKEPDDELIDYCSTSDPSLVHSTLSSR
jgi:hypothetical protein